MTRTEDGLDRVLLKLAADKVKALGKVMNLIKRLSKTQNLHSLLNT